MAYETGAHEQRLAARILAECHAAVDDNLADVGLLF
jgi:hypothetical protein